jgi:hypothetical protein
LASRSLLAIAPLVIAPDIDNRYWFFVPVEASVLAALVVLAFGAGTLLLPC